MSKYEFVADRGVEFGEHVGFKSLEQPGEFRVWAKFVRDHSLDTPTGQKRYAFGTDDAKVAERVRAVKDYGIVETSKAASADD